MGQSGGQMKGLIANGRIMEKGFFEMESRLKWTRTEFSACFCKHGYEPS
jgi:hypothetical protein